MLCFSLVNVRRESAHSLNISCCMATSNKLGWALNSVVVSVHHNHASGLIKVYQEASGFVAYRLFGRSHLGRSTPRTKVWHKTEHFKGELRRIVCSELYSQQASDSFQSRLAILNF